MREGYALGRTVSILLLLVCGSISAQDWKWAGYEVMGQKSVGKAEILKFVPIVIGNKYEEDLPSWQKWCAEIKGHFGFAYTECSSVRFSDFKAFFVVETVEKGDEYRIKYRPEPHVSIPLASPEVLELARKLRDRIQYLFSQGTPPAETSDKGYLDYADSLAHDIVLDLVKKVPPYRRNLIEVLKDDKDMMKRATAADLLNWALKAPETIGTVHGLLDDPSSLVRNNISRFMIHFINGIDPKIMSDVIDSLALQLERPSHGDRNKAIYNVLHLLQSYPEIAPYVKRVALRQIRCLAEDSILFNVKDPAVEVLKLIGG